MGRDGRQTTDYATVGARGAWAATAALAAGQHGVVALRQMTELGMAASTVRSWVAARRLIRLHRGVFAVGHAALRSEGHHLAAVLACGPGAVLSYRSAAWLWGIRGYTAAIDVTAFGRCGRAQTGLAVHRGGRLSADEVDEVDGVPCTTVARTLLDLAWVLDQRGIDAAVEAAERRRLFDLRKITLLLARHRGRRGTARLRQALAAFDPDVLRVRSELEARFLHLCIDRGVPKPLVNRPIEAGDRALEVDFHWPAARLVAETDGRVFHGTTAARVRDAARDRALRTSGWTVIRLGWPEVVHHPDATVFDLKRRLRAAGRPTGGFR